MYYRRLDRERLTTGTRRPSGGPSRLIEASVIRRLVDIRAPRQRKSCSHPEGKYWDRDEVVVGDHRDDLWRLTPVRRLYPLPVRRASTLPPASFRSPVARGTLPVQLALPLAGCAKDFHLQERAPGWAQTKKRRSPCGLRRSCSSAFTCRPRSSALQLLWSVLPLDTVARVTN